MRLGFLTLFYTFTHLSMRIVLSILIKKQYLNNFATFIKIRKTLRVSKYFVLLGFLGGNIYYSYKLTSDTK